jgi:hypothetical protein
MYCDHPPAAASPLLGGWRMSHERTTRFKVGTAMLWVVLTAAAYVVLWKDVVRWTGKWPAPYWFAVGLGVLLAGGLLRTGWVHFTWLVPFACFAFFVAWFFSDGVYRTWAQTVIIYDYRWYYENWWPEKVPTVAVMATLFFFFPFQDRVGAIGRRCAAMALFTAALFGMLALAEPLCSFSLPRAGTTDHGNYDIFGFRLGVYYLVALVIALSLPKLLLLTPAKQLNEKPA